VAEPPVLYGPDGQPIRREVLTSEIAAPSMLGMRSPFTAHPVVGLNPRSLAALLREADMGDPLRYFELAEVIEERDPHYVGILGTRKRSVTQLAITVEAASDSADDVAQADMVRAWLTRDELQDELFNILDAVGKGISYTEIIWDFSEKQYMPARLEWRDPRWFRFSPIDGRTPFLRDNAGDQRLPPFKFITASIAAKSGLPVRSGLARLATWSWMFKAFTLRDWAIFAQTFGQPVRVGKYPPGASEADKATLFDAVANIAGDCAAIIPESMNLDFIESKNVGAGADLYEKRADWLDKQMSKAVLGQTATTDATPGKLGSGTEHRQVQEDIERADAKALSAIINRDLVRPWVQLERGPQKAYCKVKIGHIEEADTEGLADDLDKLVPLGLEVQMSEVRDRYGFSDPQPGAVLLKAPVTFREALNPGEAAPIAAQSRGGQARLSADDIERLALAAEKLAQPANDQMIDAVRNEVDHASSLEDLRTRISKLRLPQEKLASALQLALMMAQLSGRADIADAGHQS